MLVESAGTLKAALMDWKRIEPYSGQACLVFYDGGGGGGGGGDGSPLRNSENIKAMTMRLGVFGILILPVWSGRSSCFTCFQ